MPGPVRNTRDDILEAAYGLFYARGFSRVSMDAIAERAGVTKRTVYYHFPSKDDVAAEVLGALHEVLLRQVKGWLAAAPDGAGAAEKADALFASLLRWAEAPGWLGSGYSRVSMELADLPGHPARKAASTHKRAVEDWLAGELARSGRAGAAADARHLMLLIEGAMGLTLIHGDPAYVRAARDAACALLAQA